MINVKDRDKILSLIRNGLSTESIRTRLRGRFSKMQIAAVRAWETMGGYNGRKGRPRTRPTVRSTTSLCQRDRRKIITRVKRGWATEKIVADLDNQYTTMQVAAVRAWVTMGKY